MINKIIKGLIMGILLVGALWIFVNINKDPFGYGMAILPLILTSIILFIIGFVVGAFIFKSKDKKIKK